MSKINYDINQKCCGCRVALRNKNYSRNVSRIGNATLEKTRVFFNNNEINVNDYICNKCRHYVKKNNTQQIICSAKKEIKNNSESKENSSQKSEIDETIEEFQTAQKIQLSIASFTHQKCFLCKSKKKLHEVKKESILFAYKYYGIVIKCHTRCCSRHLERNGLIKPEEFKNITTQTRLFDKDVIKLLDISLEVHESIEHELTHSSGVFDKFKDLASLDETQCLKITGWTRIQLSSFSKYISCVRDTAGRTKEQLVAIYRYWLLKGIDQCSLSMFKSNSNQQQISHYLSQIRFAMNEEIVPLFLGANKGKDFFLKHNTESVKILHDFDDETLAVIVDGTYTKLEKSSNNDFQYLSYSLQKSQNLIKPFIMCCADGYFIDCYGPFQANMNDAQILRYVLEKDEHLTELFSPSNKIMLFLDRGMIFFIEFETNLLIIKC